MAEQPSRIQQIATITSDFPMSAEAKEEAIRLALEGVDDASIAAVYAALDIAVPAWKWVAAHTVNPALAMEHAVEQGRHEVVDSLARELERRKSLNPK